jgi:hypothetical protein
VVLLASAPLWAQLTVGGIAGTVKDPSGAVVKGARITITNEATGANQTTASNSTGTYVFGSVPVGTYTLRADVQGFETYADTGIQVHIQNIVTADIPLVPGMVTQHVTVTSAVPLLQAQDATLGQTVPTEQINDLPLNGRNWLSLAQLSAGSYAIGAPGSSTIFANGASAGQVDVRLNGTDNNNEIFGGVNVAPVPDAMQEFKLQDGNNSAQFGQFAGSVVNAEIKSGTNQLNGNVWEYWRNEALNANGYFNDLHHVPLPEYRQNQFGGTIGGPVYIPRLYDGRNKTFFFFDYQHTGVTQQSQYTETIPTALMQSSGFTNLQDMITGNSGTSKDALGRTFAHGTVLDPATTRGVAPGATDPISGLQNTTANTVYVRDPFYTGGSVAGIKDFTGLTSQLNIIPKSRLDPNAVKLLSTFPAPTSLGLHNNYYASPVSPSATDQYDIRADQNFRAKDVLWGVFSWSKATSAAVQPYPGPIGEILGSQTNNNPHYVISLHYSHVFSSEMENEITGGYTHETTNLTQPDANTLGVPAQYGIQGIPQFEGNGGLPAFEMSGISNFGGHGFRPTISADTGLQFQDNLMKMHGNHEFNVGFHFNHIRGNILQPSGSRGVIYYNGQYSDIPNANSAINGISDLLLTPIAATVPNGINNLGSMNLYDGTNFAKTYYFADYYAAYFQDNWRPTSDLTVNLGLRWDYFSPYGESSGRQGNLIMNGGNGPGGIYYVPEQGCQVPRSAAFNTLLANANIQVKCVSGDRVNQAQKDNFAPRIGFAYRILPRFVIRGGYGISYGAFDSVGYGNTLGTNYPFQYTIGSASTTSQIPELLPDGVTTATMENTFGQVNLSNPALVNPNNLYLFGKQYKYLTPLIQTVNVTLQDQFTSRDSIQAGYVGSLGRRLDSFGSHNTPTVILPVGVNAQPYAPAPALARGSQFLESKAASNYHSLQTTYQHQFKNNLVLLANYTYGKCMSSDNGQSGLDGTGYRAEWLPGFGIDPDYSLCTADSTHLIHVSGEYALPFGRGERFAGSVNRWVDALIGGWQLNYIFTYQSGQPINIGCPVGTTSDFGCNAFTVQGQNPYAGPHSQTQWLNPSAFAQPPKATQGETDFAPLGGRPYQVRGPGFYNLDSSLFKTFALEKRTSLEFRAEAFNTFNNLQLGAPGQLNFTNPTAFSAITGTRNGPRVGQLALKLIF